MKLIGLEFCVGMQNFRDIEVVTVPLDLVFGFPFTYPHGPQANVTLHTSRGDVWAKFELGNLTDTFTGSINFDEIQKHYEKLRAQVERPRV